MHSLPLIQHREKTQKWKDPTFTAVCAKSKMACRIWREAGSPREGPLYDEKCCLRRTVRKRVRFCDAQAENRRIQKRDKDHFQLPQSKKKVHTKLLIVGKFIESTPFLLGLVTLRI